jgi:hypothetical protein
MKLRRRARSYRHTNVLPQHPFYAGITLYNLGITK